MEKAKETKLKVQAQIMEDQVRVFGKNKDDLQAVIKLLRERDLGIEIQFTNYPFRVVDLLGGSLVPPGRGSA